MPEWANQSKSYYVDGDTISGFHYELIQAFARDKRLKAEITPVMSFEERLKGLSDCLLYTSRCV